MDERDPNRRHGGHTTLPPSSKLELLALNVKPSWLVHVYNVHAQGGTVN